MDAVEMLKTGIELTTGDRKRTHGDFYETHVQIAALWSAVLGIEIKAWQVSACMALVKIARLCGGTTNPDDGVDGAVYIARAVECKAQEEKDSAGYDLAPGAINIVEERCHVCGGPTKNVGFACLRCGAYPERYEKKRGKNHEV